MHWQISTQTSTKYCFCVSQDKKIQCISSASKQQQFKDNESLWIYLNSKTVEEKNTARLEGLENGSKKECGKDHWGWSSCWPSSLQNITDVITVSSAAAAAGDRWEWAGPGARRLASCVLARISFPPKLRQGWCGSLTSQICGHWGWKGRSTKFHNHGEGPYDIIHTRAFSWLKAATTAFTFN